MKKTSSFILTALIAFSVLSMTFPKNAYAYLDPGSINFFLQMVVAACAAIAYALKVYWANVRVFFKKVFSKREPSES